jgi:hypothetical protein
VGFDGFGSQVPGGGYTPRKNNKTGKWDKPVARSKRSSGPWAAVMILFVWLGIFSVGGILLWVLLFK